jgi:FkbM family methyltransferase
LQWLVTKLVLGIEPVKRTKAGVRLTGFRSFSEFHSSDLYLCDEELEFLDRCNPDDGVFLDVGANVGLISLYLAKRCPSCKIYAFEPIAEAAVALRQNIHLNSAENVIALELAVAGRTGALTMTGAETATATARIASPSQSNGVSVQAVSLDDFCEENAVDQIGLLKVDVEGFERLVFDGATRVLREIRPSRIFFEVCPELAVSAGFKPDSAAQSLEDAGYMLFKMEERALRRVHAREAADSKFENWIAIPQERSDAVRHA